METVTDFIFLGSRITADGDCSHEIKRHLLLGRKAMSNQSSMLKSKDITLPTKVCLVKAMVFPVFMYGCESWTIKKAERGRIDAFELWCWRRFLRILWTARRSNQSILKEISPEYSLEGLMLKLKLQYFGYLTHWKRTWCWERLKAGGERDDRDEMVGWHHWLNGHEFEQSAGVGDGQGGLACCSPWGRKESNTTEQLNWTELDSKEIKPVSPKGNQPWIFIGRTDSEAKALKLQSPDANSWLTGKDPDAGKDWQQEEKEMREDEMVGWHHQFNGHEFEEIPGDSEGQGSLVCCNPWGRKESDTTDQLNNKVYGSGALRVFTLPCNPSPELFHLAKLKLCAYHTLTSYASFSQPWHPPFYFLSLPVWLH